MATKTLTIKKDVEVCDLCDGEVVRGFKDEDTGKIFDSITCKYFFIFQTPEKFVAFRKSQREGIEVED